LHKEVEAAGNGEAEVAGSAEAAPVQLTWAAAIFQLAVLRLPAAQLRSSAATLAKAVLAAAKPAPVSVTSKVTLKLLTFTLKAIVGSVTTRVATMLITILIGLGNMDISAARLAATIFIV
jgi:hypothetical protein